MAKGAKSAVRAVKQKGITGLAWCSFAIAVVGGTLATETFLGRVVQGFLGLWPWEWIPPVLLAVAVIGLSVDIFIDSVPNQMAILSALTMPSIAASVTGRLGDEVSHWCGRLLAAIDGWLHVWVTESATGLAVACILGALVMARRVVRKSRAAGVA
ncbi:hypothetical protein [Salinispora sp. H7-4]|uniref:hypothetical protein n=1 Tax=Salinispora sp. H7-4 TaxID=2748321 RepID=UPI0015D2B489|nr:hypothetical protein [Salinispora sp. H7-4]NYT96429.1 hypothetical protein [Salinispora sp. H7-4]